MLHWIRDFLSDRRQQVAVGCGASSWTRNTSGVPQGSVLGPTLFVIYINEIPKIVKSKCKLFADDTKLFHEISNDEDAHRKIFTPLWDLFTYEEYQYPYFSGMKT